jgi:hypothetical protein
MWSPATVPLPPISAVLSQGGRATRTISRERVARHFGVRPEQVWVGSDLLSRLFSALTRPGDHVLVAEPTCPEVLNAVVTSGARYVDCGRNHRFEIDRGGYRCVLSDPRTRLVHLASPNEPTGHYPSVRRIEEARSTGAIVLWDQRYTLRPYERVRIEPGVLVIRTLHLGAGLSGPPTHCVFGTPELLQLLGRFRPPDELWGEALVHTDQTRRRLRIWARTISRCRKILVPWAVHPAGSRLSSGLWLRVPGMPSQEIATALASDFVVGSTAWTWRDAVRVCPSTPRIALELCDRFRAL